MPCSNIDNDILEHNRAVPRYTSYPTTPNFQEVDDRSADIHLEWIKGLSGDNKVSLYIHVPFCKEMCWYCGCHTKATRSYEPVSKYVEYLLKEIELLATHIDNKVQVYNLHFGGGSPGYLSAEDFTRVIKTIRKHFKISVIAEMSIELDPRLVTAERIEAYANSGVNRVSIGVQDFDQKVLTSVNRPQPYELTRKTVELCRWHHIPHISFDLMCGLPHQKMESLLDTIDRACALSPDRISFFSYAHVPWMKKHMSLIDSGKLPNTEERLDLFEQGKNRLQKNGYKMIGIDHFAKEQDSLIMAKQYGTIRRNFQGYTTDQYDTLIGLGTSSISQFSHGYTQNYTDTPLYKEAIDNKTLPVKKICVLSEIDRMHSEVIEDIMCHFQVDLAEKARTYNLDGDYFSPYLDKLDIFIGQGFVRLSGSHEFPFVEITEKPYMLARLVAAAFDAYHVSNKNAQKHSNAV